MQSTDIPSLKKAESDGLPSTRNDIIGIKEIDIPTTGENKNAKYMKSSQEDNDKHKSDTYPHFPNNNPPPSQQKTSFTDKVKNWATNLNFKLENDRFEANVEHEVYILGRVFSPIEKKEIGSAIKDVIWLSYRERFPSLLSDIYPNKNYTSDRGWGCMLRCGQMLFAEAIKRHYRSHKVLNEKNRMDVYFSIISMFADCNLSIDEAPFSIQQIARVAHENYSLKPGEWYRGSNIMGALLRLSQENKYKHLKNFKVANFVDGTIFEDQILNKAMGIEPTKPEIKKEEEQKQEKQEIKETAPVWKNSVLVFVASKTGLDHHNEIYLPSILTMLTFPESIGMLSGQDARAYYFLGRQGDRLLYLDPHFVQEAISNLGDVSKILKSYFVDSFFEMKINQMDTSIGLGFYIKNEKEYVEFKNRLYKCIEADPNFLVGFEIETPSLEGLGKDVIEVVDNDGSFEIIS